MEVLQTSALPLGYRAEPERRLAPVHSNRVNAALEGVSGKRLLLERKGGAKYDLRTPVSQSCADPGSGSAASDSPRTVAGRKPLTIT